MPMKTLMHSITETKLKCKQLWYYFYYNDTRDKRVIRRIRARIIDCE